MHYRKGDKVISKQLTPTEDGDVKKGDRGIVRKVDGKTVGVDWGELYKECSRDEVRHMRPGEE